MASNIQAGTRGLSAGDWVRLKRLRGSRNYVNESYKDVINPSPLLLETTQGARRVFTEFGTSKIRRPASFWTDYRASQKADYVLESQDTQTKSRSLDIQKVCGCSTSSIFVYESSAYTIIVAEPQSMFPIGAQIVFSGSTNSNIENGRTYYIVYTYSDFGYTYIQISETPGGEAIDLGVHFEDPPAIMTLEGTSTSAIKHNGLCIKCIHDPIEVIQKPVTASYSAGTLQFTSNEIPSYLKVGSKASLYPGTDAFTISFYLNMTSIGPLFPRVFALSSDNDGQILAVSIEAGTFYVWINGGNRLSFDYSSFYGSWHFINIVSSNGLTSRTLSVEIDGVTQSTTTSSAFNDIPQSVDSTAALNIGSYPQDTEYELVSMTGYLANFRWVVGSEIHYNSGSKPNPPLPVIPTQTSLFLLANTVDTAYDDSGTDSGNTVITLQGPTPPVWSSQVVA